MKRVTGFLKAFQRDTSGATAIEYGLVATFIAVAIIASIQAVGDKGLEGEPIKIDCDVICMAVGLTPTAELLWQAGCDMQFVGELCGYVHVVYGPDIHSQAFIS